MAFEHEPLTEAQLGPMVAKMVAPAAPPQMRKMVASGIAPLPPRDLIVGLYQLWVLNEDPYVEMAARTAEGLPPPVLDGAIGDASLPPGVLDFMARKLLRQAEPLDKLVRHAMVSDETIIGIARVCPEIVCDTLADNEERWLRCPKIAESLYRNPNAKMSVVHRMLELAEREHVELRLPGMEEIRIVMRGEEVDPERDGLFRRAVAGRGEVLDEQLERLSHSRADDDLEQFFAAEEQPDRVEPADESTANDATDDVAPHGSAPATTASTDAVSADSPPGPTHADAPEGGAESLPAPEAGEPGDFAEGLGDDHVAALDGEVSEADPAGVAASRENRLSQLLQMRPLEKIRAALLGDQFDRSILVRDSNKMVAMATIKSPKIRADEIVGYSANRSLSHDVVRYIANRRDWVRLYAVKFNLVMNPKTPMSRAMALLGHLHGTDVRKVSRSKNISSALAKAAKRRSELRR